MYLMLCLISGAAGGATLGAWLSGAGRTLNTGLGLIGGGAAYAALVLLGAGGTLTGAVDLGVTATQAGAGFIGGAGLAALVGRIRRAARS